MLRLPGLRVRTAPRRKRWGAVPGREPIQEECATDQASSQRPAGAVREGIMAASARSTKPASAGLVGVLQLWHPDAGLSGRRLSRLRSRQTLLAQSVEAARAWCTEPLPCYGFRVARCSTASTRAAYATAVGHTMKLVGKPDAGNRPVRFDEIVYDPQ